MTAAATSLPNTASTPHNFEVASNPVLGPQNQKRPLGLNLSSASNNNHGFPHYPVSAPSSSAPLRPLPPNQSPVPQIQRNASFSFAPSTVPNNYQALVPSHTLSSAPPSATIPLPPSSSMPAIHQALQSQNNGRARLPLFHPNSVPAHHRTDVQPGSDGPSSHPALVRPSSASALSAPNLSNSKNVTRDGSAVPPVSLNNFPGLGFAVQPAPTPQNKTAAPPNATPGPSSGTGEAGRFFNTYIYDYLLKQGLCDVARAFVFSGAEFDLVEGRENSNPGPQSANKPTSNTRTSTVHKRRRSEASINNLNTSPHGTSNAFPNHEGQTSANPKAGTAACELLPSERSMSSSGSSVSNASHYGFNHTDSNRSSNETPGSQPPNSDPSTNPVTVNGNNGAGACSRTSTSPRSSPPDSHISLDSLPKPKLAMDTEMGFLFEWWSIFWDVFRAKTGRAPAQSKPAQLYAQTVASLSASTESNGMSKARREALGIVAVPNPVDLQKGQLNDRIQQQYTLFNSGSYDALQQESISAAGPRLSAYQLQTAKNAILAEQAARQQQMNRAQQQQQQHQHFQRVDVNLARQRQQAQAHHQQQQAQQQHHHQQQQQQQGQQHHHQQQQQQQQELQRAQDMRQSQHMHQIHPAHHDQFMQQRQLPANVRRVGMMPNMGPDQAHVMMPPPNVAHGSPLNPHQQAYRSSRPPSRSGAVHVASPFVSNQPQPPRQPSRASNHANSPAVQPHPRTPSASHASTPQPSAPPNRGSPLVNNGEQERKKRRLNEPVFGPNDPLTPESSGAAPAAQPLHQLTHQQQQQMLAQQHQFAQHHLQQMNHQQLSPQQQHQQHANQQNLQQQHHMMQMQPPRRSMTHNGEFAGSPNDTSSSNINAEAYKQSIHGKHNQTVSPLRASSVQKGPTGSSPNKEAGNKPDENSMPPPSSRNMTTQPSTPQPNAGVNKTTESTPLPAIVAPSPNVNPRPASRNDPSGPGASMTSSSDQQSVSNPMLMGKPNSINAESKSNNATADGQAVNLSGDASAEHQNEKSLFSPDVGSKPHEKQTDNLWSLDLTNAGGSQQKANHGVSSNISPTANQAPRGLTDDLTSGGNNTNPMDQLFNGDAMSFDLDTCLFEAFINYDPSSDLPNAEFS